MIEGNSQVPCDCNSQACQCTTSYHSDCQKSV